MSGVMQGQQIHEKQYVRLSKLVDITDLSRATIWRRIKNAGFPAPIKLSSNCARWELSAVLGWLEQKKEETEATRRAKTK